MASSTVGAVSPPKFNMASSTETTVLFIVVVVPLMVKFPATVKSPVAVRFVKFPTAGVETPTGVLLMLPSVIVGELLPDTTRPCASVVTLEYVPAVPLLSQTIDVTFVKAIVSLLIY